MSHIISFEMYKHLGIVTRDNVEKTNASITDTTWRAVRNTADNANLSMEIECDGGEVVVEMSMVMWANTQAYKELRCLLDGTPVGTNLAVSYLVNEVSAGGGAIKFTPTAGAHTLTFQWRQNTATSATIGYRQFMAKAYEIVGGTS